VLRTKRKAFDAIPAGLLTLAAPESEVLIDLAFAHRENRPAVKQRNCSSCWTCMARLHYAAQSVKRWNFTVHSQAYFLQTSSITISCTGMYS
jgi:hypothetical protein